MGSKFNIMIVAQAGRLEYEALIFLASLRHSSPNFGGRVFVAIPEAGDKWDRDPNISGDVQDLLTEMGAEFIRFPNHHFGQSYPHGNKIEALLALPAGEPFVFFDTDTLITGNLAQVPFDFHRPSASLRVEGTWPQLELYGPGYGEIWHSLYDQFGLDFHSSLDLTQPDEYWRRYLYFNAGFFYFHCPHEFGQRFLEYAVDIRDNPPKAAQLQSYDPWLDQVALPLVIHSFGGGRDALPRGFLDGTVSCHYRMLPLLYARETDHVVEVLETILSPNKIKKTAKTYEPIHRMVYQGRGQKVRALFDQNNLPRKEQQIRNKIKRGGFWMR